MPPTTTASPNRILPVRPLSSLHATGLSQDKLPPVAIGDSQRFGLTSATKSPHDVNSTPTSAYCPVSVTCPDDTILGPLEPVGWVDAHPENSATAKAALITLIGFIAISITANFKPRINAYRLSQWSFRRRYGVRYAWRENHPKFASGEWVYMIYHSLTT